MSIDTDLGIRCDRHVGEAFAVRCATCESLEREWRSLNQPVRYTTEECPEHKGYFLPCDFCKRMKYREATNG